MTSPESGRPRSRGVSVTAQRYRPVSGLRARKPNLPRPAGRRHTHLGGQHLPGSFLPLHRVRPSRADDEQGAATWAAERAGEAAAVGLDGLEDLAAFRNTYAVPAGHAGVPSGILGIEANTVRRGILAELGPNVPAGQAAVGLDLVSGELARVRLRHHQSPIVLRHC